MAGGWRRGTALTMVAAGLVLGAQPASATTSSSVVVSTMAGTGSASPPSSGHRAVGTPLDGPQAIGADSSGDIAIADTGACQIDVVAAHPGRLLGHHVTAAHLVVVAGSSCHRRLSTHGVGVPIGVAWGVGGLYVLNAATDSVVVIGPSGHVAPVAGDGRSRPAEPSLPAHRSPLDHPEGIATDAAGDLFIADTGDCRVLLVPRQSGVHYGQSMEAGHLYAVAGSGTCTLSNPTGPASSAQLSSPTRVSVDASGDLFITESGRQDVDEVPVSSGTYFGVPIAAGGIAPVAGSGSNNTYLAEGQPATGSYAELNYPEGTTVDPQGDLFIADGLDQAIKVVPSHTATVFGQPVTAGDLYTLAGAEPTSAAGQPAGDKTRWIGGRLVDPTGIAFAGGRLVVADPGANKVWAIS